MVPRATTPTRTRLLLAKRDALELVSEIVVGLVKPVLAGRTEDVNIKRVLQRDGLVGHMRWEVQHFTGRNNNSRLVLVANEEVEAALENVGELLIFMRVHGDNAPFLQVDMGQHHSIGRNDSPVEKTRHTFFRHIVPAVVGDTLIGHSLLHLLCDCLNDTGTAARGPHEGFFCTSPDE